MDKIAKLYYKAVSYYYVANDIVAAKKNCYEALNISPYAQEFFYLLRQIKKANTISIRSCDCLIKAIEQDNIDLYLLLLLAELEVDSVYLHKINWSFILDHFSNNTQSKIWRCFLTKNWQDAKGMVEQQKQSIQGNPVVYFQYALCQFFYRNFEESEKYLFLLCKFGGAYMIAALNLLLKLPQRQFDTLAKYDFVKKSDTYISSIEQYVYMGYVLQRSWDNEAFNVYAKNLYKKASTNKEYFYLLYLYGNSADWDKVKKCISALKQISFSEIKELVTFLQRHGRGILLQENESFFSRLMSKLETDSLRYLCEFIEEKIPHAALKGYQKIRTEDEDLSILGKVRCYFYLGKYKKAEKLLSFVSSRNKVRVEKWKLLIFAKRDSRNAIKSISNIEMASDVVATTAHKLLESHCPACSNLLSDNICVRCNYERSGVFKWENNSLQIRKIPHKFPQEIIIVTTNSSLYVDKNVHIITFSTCEVEATLFIYKGNEVILEKKIILGGLRVFDEELSQMGIYQIKINTSLSTVQCLCLRAKKSEELYFYCKSQKWLDKNILETTFVFCDVWKQAISFTIELYDAANNTLIEPLRMEKLKGEVKVSWRIPDEISRCVYFIGKTVQNYWITSVKILKISSWRDIEDYFCRSFSSKNIKYRFLRDVLRLSFERSFAEIEVLTVPISKDFLNIHRFYNVDVVDIPLPSFLSGAHMGTTRFVSSEINDVGLENSFYFLRKPPELRISYPKEIEPIMSFEVEISSNFCGKLHVFSQRGGTYFSLKEALLKTKFDFINVEKQELLSNDNRSCFVGSYDFDCHKKIRLQALDDEGTIKYTFFASDGHFFNEKVIAINCSKKNAIYCQLPKNIGEKDSIEIPIYLKSRFKENYSIDWQKQGNVTKGIMEGHFSQKIEIRKNDTLFISLAQERYQGSISQLEIISYSKPMWEKVEFDNGNCNVKQLSSILSHRISSSLLLNVESIAAKLYALALLYLDNAKVESEILLWQCRLKEATSSFKNRLWAYTPDLEIDKNLSIEILNHLSIYLEIPKFSTVIQQVRELIDQCLLSKLKDNRLLAVSLDFQEKARCPMSSAGLVLHDIDIPKNIKYLKKQKKWDSATKGIYWHSYNIGGDIVTTIWVAKALLHAEEYELFEQTMTYIDAQNDIWSSITNVAYLQLLSQIGKKKLRISWKKTENQITENILKDAKKANLSFRFRGNNILSVGDEFTLKAKSKKLKYPCFALLIPPHVTLKVNLPYSSYLQGYNILPECHKNLDLTGKILYKGIGTIHVILYDAYDCTHTLFDSYQIVVP